MPKFEFVVFGTPRTATTKKSTSRRAWSDKVRRAAASEWPTGQSLLLGELSAQIVFFFAGNTDLDIDNIIKPILDSLKGLVFEDDETIFEVTCRKTPLLARTMLTNAPPMLIGALADDKELVFVRITDGPKHEELPT